MLIGEGRRADLLKTPPVMAACSRRKITGFILAVSGTYHREIFLLLRIKRLIWPFRKTRNSLIFRSKKCNDV